jgi:hypothetical protein
LPEIGHALGTTTENQRKWIVATYMLGIGAAQIIYGPSADRFGRKPVLLAGLGIYALASLVAMFSESFDTLLVARAAQGIGAASTPVLAVSIVRDCYSARKILRPLDPLSANAKSIDDDFIRSLAETIEPDSSALFVLVRKAQPEKVLAELSGVRGRVLRSSLSPDQERRLEAALAEKTGTVS